MKGRLYLLFRKRESLAVRKKDGCRTDTRKEKVMLIAVDQSENAERAVSYAARMVGNHPEITVTILNVIRAPGEDVEPDPEARARVLEEKRQNGQALVSGLARLMTGAGLPPERVRTKVSVFTVPQTAADGILKEKREGGYETVVVGRRGVSRKDEFLFGSVSARVIREAGSHAVWVVA